MSTLKQKGQYYGLYVVVPPVPPATTPTNELIACLKSKGFDISNKVIDGTSDCGPDYAPGFPNSKFDVSGFVNFNDMSTVSGETLFDYANNQTIATFSLQPVGTPVTGDLTRTFTGFLSSYKETMNTDAYVEFTATLQVQGEITQTIHS